ncbi:MAG TPA: lipid-binding SYLF domain-containing protein [Vicinamibacterales bacterium]
MHVACGVILALIAFGGPVQAETAAERLAESTTVLKEIMSAPDKGIPTDLLKKAHCVVIVPGLKKAGLIIGGKYGRGFLVCRDAETNAWGAPAALRIEGGSFGFQIGASETDVVMLLMDPRSVQGILSSRFTLGGDADVAAGPVGRSTTAQTDATMRAKILSYSRSRGVFAGLALTGATIRQDLDENNEMYGRKWTTREIIEGGKVAPPRSASDLIELLTKYSQG